MNKGDIDQLVAKAEEQGYIYVCEIDKEITKMNLTIPFNKKHRCWFAISNIGIVLPIYAKDYGMKQFCGWALTEEELKND